jgi:FKBP-type peptidyl-prolyl cis-trans isomerase FkpA
MSVRTFAVLTFTLIAFGCSSDTPSSPSTPSTPMPTAPFSQTDLRVGTGAPAVNGRFVTVNYTGWLYDPAGVDGKGQQFESNQIRFLLGGGSVIRGWDVGVVGIRVGGLRRLVIPPDLAYGAQGRNAIPGNATLVFDIELIAVE